MLESVADTPQHRILPGAMASAVGIMVAWTLSVPATDTPEPPMKSKSSDNGDAEDAPDSVLADAGGTQGLGRRLSGVWHRALREAAVCFTRADPFLLNPNSLTVAFNCDQKSRAQELSQ